MTYFSLNTFLPFAEGTWRLLWSLIYVSSGVHLSIYLLALVQCTRTHPVERLGPSLSFLMTKVERYNYIKNTFKRTVGIFVWSSSPFKLNSSNNLLMNWNFGLTKNIKVWRIIGTNMTSYLWQNNWPTMEEWCCISGRKGCMLLWYTLLPRVSSLHCCRRSCTTVRPLSSYSKLKLKKR